MREDKGICMFWEEPIDPESHKGECKIGGGGCSQKWLFEYGSCIYYKDFKEDFPEFFKACKQEG